MGGIQGLVSLVGRMLLVAIFLSSALMNDIPQFEDVSRQVADAGVPMPKVALGCAIVLLLAGGTSVLLGFKARLGALLLLVFLVLATYYFHDFWTIEDAAEMQQQQIQFMKNLALMGTMLFILANGPGAWSLDACCRSAAGDEGNEPQS